MSERCDLCGHDIGDVGYSVLVTKYPVQVTSELTVVMRVCEACGYALTFRAAENANTSTL